MAPCSHNKEQADGMEQREPAHDCGDLYYYDGGLDSPNAGYLARAGRARQVILSHPVFKGIVDAMPLTITGAQEQPSGVQDCLLLIYATVM